MIRFERLSKDYGRRRAVDELTLAVPPGQVYVLLGPNGAGKTTALRCLATLLPPTSGTVTVAGADVSREPLTVRSRIGFLATSMGLYERLTPRELIRYFGRLHGLRKERLEARTEELVRRFGIGEFADRYCGRLSTGQRQRVSIARAVVHDPPALALDEPTLGLDLISGETIHAFLWEERERGKAILFSTHQMETAELIADRIGVLVDGRLVAEGTAREHLERTGQPTLARAFLRTVATSPDEEEVA